MAKLWRKSDDQFYYGIQKKLLKINILFNNLLYEDGNRLTRMSIKYDWPIRMSRSMNRPMGA